MKDRIQQIIDYKGVTAGELAEMLEVQRSNVSHVLNGRNKPGAVFLEKFLHVFPELNARWLITGEGKMLSAASGSQVSDHSPSVEKNQQQKLFSPPVYDSTHDSLLEDKEIEKVILLYTDGTFTYYNK